MRKARDTTKMVVTPRLSVSYVLLGNDRKRGVMGNEDECKDKHSRALADQNEVHEVPSNKTVVMETSVECSSAVPVVAAGSDHQLYHLQGQITLAEYRARAEAAAEYEVEHNWLLKEQEEIRARNLLLTKRKLTILLPEDDSLENISNRLEEVQSMVKPKAEFSTLLKDLPSEQKDRILVSTLTLSFFLSLSNFLLIRSRHISMEEGSNSSSNNNSILIIL